MSTAASEMATDCWRRVRLGDAIELAYGKNLPKPQRREGSVPVYGSNGVAGWHDEALVENSTVIVGRKGSAGAVHLVEGPCFPIDTTYYTRPRAGFEFDVRFLAYALRSLNLERLRTSTGVPGLSREDAYREFLPVPTLPEQRHIADVLSRAENIVRMRREAEQKAKEIIPALFLDMFGDPATNPKGWVVKTIGDITAYTRYGPRFPDRKYAETGARILRTTDMDTAGGVRWADAPVLPISLEEAERFTLRPGTIVVTRTGATIGKVALFRGAAEPCIAGAYLIEVGTTGEVEPDYVLGLLLSRYGQDRLTAGSRVVAQPNLNAPSIRAIPLPIPPYSLQASFAKRAAAVRDLIDQEHSAINLSSHLFQSLLARVFGESG